MKQIEFETHIKAGNVAEVVFDYIGQGTKWHVVVHLTVGSTAAVHAARGQVKSFSSLDSALYFVRDCGWREAVRIAADLTVVEDPIVQFVVVSK